ncbi:helix-turn-helix transcriptional regulator [Bacteroides sp. GD17]|jgi:AraC-like DNA-binding protein|uniref:helix-turn-helix transcriptional regulator n=1 Tax=Bacteroides sp. GD17 TaxID=3139826 RepID=UPI0025DE994A|nr:helix-turn-helix transcriptional regulator [uncultured Bacteroides sp.]
MPNSSVCGATNIDCHSCSKATDNIIIYASHPRGFHLPAQKCEENILIFLLKGEVLVNSNEYAGTTLHAGEFILQAIGSKYEILAMTDVECVCYRFEQPRFFCETRYKHIANEVEPPLIYSPLKIKPEVQYFLDASKSYMREARICKELLAFKQKELGFLLGQYYSDYELSMLVHPLSKYTNSFEYFVLKNHNKVKTVEELAKLGGYTTTTFRRIFTSVFHQPVYEWMQERRREGIMYELQHTDATISEICYKYGFESLPHFSNFCKKNFGLSPRLLRTAGKEASQVPANL